MDQGTLFHLEAPQLLTCREVAMRYRVNPETVRRWVRKGIIRVVLVGPYKAMRIPVEEADRHFITVPGADAHGATAATLSNI